MPPPQEKTDLITWKDLQHHLLWWVGLIYRTFRFFTSVWRKHPLLTSSMMIIFIALFLGILYLKSNEYEMKTTYSYSNLHPKIFGDMVEKLNAFMKYGRYDKVGELMNISRTHAQKLKEIEVTDTRGKPLSRNYFLRVEPIIVTITLSDPVSEDTLRQAITHYLNSNPFTAERLELRKRLLEEELSYINTKLETIDSILSNLYADQRPIESDQGAINIENAEGKNAYELLSFSRELLNRKSTVENGLIHPENVVAIDNSLLIPKARLGPAFIIIFGLAGAFAGYCVTSMIVFWREKLMPLVESRP